MPDSERHLTMREFSRATGRSISQVKSMVLGGDLPTVDGHFIGRDDLGRPQYAPLIPESAVSGHFDSEAYEGRRYVDPRSRSEEVRKQAAAKRDQQVAVEADDPEARRAAAMADLEAANAQAQAALRAIIGV